MVRRRCPGIVPLPLRGGEPKSQHQKARSALEYLLSASSPAPQPGLRDVFDVLEAYASSLG